MANSKLERLREFLANMGELGEALMTTFKHAIEKNNPRFSIRFVTNMEKDQVRFDVDFFKMDGAEDYSIERFKTVVLGTIPISHGIIHGIDTLELEEKIAKVPWKKLAKSAQEEGDSENMRKALPIFLTMRALKNSPEGLKVACLLETKYMSNTDIVIETPLQRLYDQIEEEHGRSFMFAFNGNDGPSFEQAYQMVKGRSPLPLPYRGHIFKVRVDGVDFSYGDSEMQALTIPKVKDYYFSSLKKAVEYTDTLDERKFFPRIAVNGRMPDALRSVVISDEFTDCNLANKLLLSDLELNGKMVLGWEINTERISVSEFSEKSGLLLDKLELYESDRRKFIVAREENVVASLAKQQSKKAAKPKKKNGNGLG